MDRKKKLLLLGQQKFFSKEENGSNNNKRKTFSPGKVNPTPNDVKRGVTETCRHENSLNQQLQKEKGVTNGTKLSCKTQLLYPAEEDSVCNGQVITPEHQQLPKINPPHLNDKGIPVNQNNLTDERTQNPMKVRAEGKPVNVQRALFVDSREKHPPRMKSGVMFNRMTNVGFDTPPSSPLINVEKNVLNTSENIFTDPSLKPADEMLASKLPETNEDSHPLTACTRRKPGVVCDTDNPVGDPSTPFNVHLTEHKDNQNGKEVNSYFDFGMVSSPEQLNDLAEDLTANDDNTLVADLLNVGIDVTEEILVMSMTPLKIQGTTPREEERLQNSEREESLQSPHQEDNPDDPDYVYDDSAPHNLSGLDSDAGSAGESPKPRKKNIKSWKRNVNKAKNSKGLAHVSTRGKERPARDVMPEGCGNTCKRKCHSLINLEQRTQINKNYWSIGDCSRQWDYLSRHVRIVPVKRRTGHDDDPYRKHSYEYFFTVGNQEQVQVCQQMFLKTLNISVARIKVAIKKMTRKEGVISPDKRGKTGTRKRIHSSATASVRNHIESYPTYESHYTRRSSKKKYLDERLNVAKMYRNYAASRPSGTPHTATQRQYEDIFRREYKHKLGFYKPKKDQCGSCLRWKSLSPEDKLKDDADLKYQNHINNKAEARKIKDDNIKLGTEDKTVCVASFDLQKVFFCPYGENGEYIFKRKLRCYNLSVFQSVEKRGYCFVWDETTAKKGAIEISSCVWSFIEMKVAEGYTKFYFVSDNCWNQNKNCILFAMYNLASIKFNIEIHHTYLEKGHTQMEYDSIHSLIERRCKNLTLCTPQAWYGVIRTAKTPDKRKGVPFHPYVVKVMTKDNIYDFKAVSNELNFAKIPKSKVRQIQICQDVAKFKLDFNGPEEEVSLLKKRAGRPINFKTYVLKRMYSSRIPLKVAQLKDLLWLCDQKHIPEPDSQFYYILAQETETQQEQEQVEENEDDVDDQGTESEDSDS